MDRNRRNHKHKGRTDEEKEEKCSLRERLCRSLDLSPDLLPGGCVVEIRDRYRLTLRGGGRILRYTSEEVRIALRRGELSIKGRRLCCQSYYVGAVVLEGEIDSVSFEGEKGGRPA